MMKKNWPALFAFLALLTSFGAGCSDEPSILSINPEFDFDTLNDVTYELIEDGSSISHLEGHNIADGDYEISSSLLTIKKDYLIKLAPGRYDFSVWFRQHSETISLIVLDKNNEYRLVNGSFETGDYFGWSSETIFKGESNLLAFDNSSIVMNNEILDSAFAYGGEGNYVYGMPLAMTKSDFEEKMGRLVSSSFILGGSGFITYRMGAAKNADLAYISVVDSISGYELARYGNPLFDKNLTGLANASLQTYQADLSAHIGKKIHFVISDWGGRDWDFLTFDALETYLESPLENASEAVDIKPVAGAGYIPNQLANGDFSDGLNHWHVSAVAGWQKSDGTIDTWRVHEGAAKSNSGGDGSRGLLRSSFFRIDGSGIASLEIGAAQGSRFDKDTFVSVKERDSNREIIRFANSRHNGNEMIKYYIDLSDYQGEVMYFEIIDNATESWDTIFIDNVITYYENKPDFDYGQMAVNLNF